MPLVEPVYSTYHFQGEASAVIKNNMSIRNWYLNQIMNLNWNRNYLNCSSSPKINISKSSFSENPYLEKKWFSTQFLRGYINIVIKNLIDAGYYVYFGGVDDYYMQGKSWYKKRHFGHDGLICGYDQDDKTYCIYAYDSSWIYRKFWTPQTCFDAGRKAMLKKGVYTLICGLKPLQEKVEFSAEAALKSVARYLNPSDEKYSTYGDGYVYGIAVQECAAKYVGELFDGTIPYEKIDRRIFHLIWEHKKFMLERIRRIENAFGAGPEISPKYAALVKEAEIMRMLYASHHMKRRDAVLPVIQKKLLALKGEEERLLNELVEKGGVKNT